MRDMNNKGNNINRRNDNNSNCKHLRLFSNWPKPFFGTWTSIWVNEGPWKIKNVSWLLPTQWTSRLTDYHNFHDHSPFLPSNLSHLLWFMLEDPKVDLNDEYMENGKHQNYNESKKIVSSVIVFRLDPFRWA